MAEWFGQQQEQREYPPRRKQYGKLCVNMHQYVCVSTTLGLSYTGCTLGLTVQHPPLGASSQKIKQREFFSF